MSVRFPLNGCVRMAALLAWICICSGSLVYGQSPPAGTEDAIRAINEKSVTATISFLASDELAGRGTPSEGYTIASAYVASRFRGAGLVGGMPDGSFYQDQTMRTVRVPSEGVVFADESGRPHSHAGLLAAGDEPFEFSGELPRVDLQAEPGDTRFEGPVMAQSPSSDAGGGRAVAQLARAANLLKSAGATALVLYVEQNSPLLTSGEQARSRSRPESSRARLPFPVLLIVGEPPQQAAVHLKIPAKIVGEAKVRNVIGVLPGSDPNLRDQAIVFSAHLDHLGENPNAGGDTIFNGADDNASGSTAVVTLADAYAALPQRPARTLIFLSFWGEESGLLGSRQFAEQPAWPLDKIAANINIEMIGRPEAGAQEKIWMTGWGESDLGPLMQSAAAKHDFEIFEHPQYSAMLYRASDNWAFVQRGVVAHSFSAGSLHEDYHQPSDEWEKLDLPHMTRVIQALFWGSLPLATGEVTPQAKQRGDGSR